jgi:hypothetical protein
MLEVVRFIFWIVLTRCYAGLCVLIATGWGLGRAFDNGTFGGISTESGGTGNRYHSPKYVAAPRKDNKVSQV